MYTTVIVIQKGSGFPLVASDFYKDTIASVFPKSIKKIHQDKRSVVVFNADIT